MSDVPLFPEAPTLPLAKARRPASSMLTWVATVDHKKIGIMYLVVSLIFFLAGGVEAIVDAHPAGHTGKFFSFSRSV